MQLLSGVITESEYKAKLSEIGMFNDPVGYKKSELSDLDKMFTKEYKGNGVYVIYKNGKEVKTIEGEGNANAWINDEMKKLKEKKKSLNENFVGIGMVGNIFDREKTDYELAFEHFTKGTSLKENEETSLTSSPEYKKILSILKDNPEEVEALEKVQDKLETLTEEEYYTKEDLKKLLKNAGIGALTSTLFSALVASFPGMSAADIVQTVLAGLGIGAVAGAYVGHKADKGITEKYSLKEESTDSNIEDYLTGLFDQIDLGDEYEEGPELFTFEKSEYADEDLLGGEEATMFTQAHEYLSSKGIITLTDPISGIPLIFYTEGEDIVVSFDPEDFPEMD